MTPREGDLSAIEKKIDALIDEIGSLLGSVQAGDDTEFDRQLEAYRERARQAQRLAMQARTAADANMRVHDGYLRRAVVGLELSRDYFAALEQPGHGHQEPAVA